MNYQEEFIQSPLSGFFEHGGVTVEIGIFQLPEEDWSLEIVDEEGNSVVWADQFPTDEDAYAGFIHEVETEGLQSILSSETD